MKNELNSQTIKSMITSYAFPLLYYMIYISCTIILLYQFSGSSKKNCSQFDFGVDDNTIIIIIKQSNCFQSESIKLNQLDIRYCDNASSDWL